MVKHVEMEHKAPHIAPLFARSSNSHYELNLNIGIYQLKIVRLLPTLTQNPHLLYIWNCAQL